MDHRLSTILKWMSERSLAQINAMTISSRPSEVNEDFYERRRAIQLNDFNNRNLIDIIQEARYVMALNEIQPIPDWHNEYYGEREPFQEVKAHLISPYSCRVSAASRHVDDNRISDRGKTPLIDSSGPDKVSHRIRDYYNYKFHENWEDYAKTHKKYNEQKYKYYIKGEPLPLFFERMLLENIRTLIASYEYQLKFYRDKGIPLTSTQKEFLLLRLITTSIANYGKQVLNYAERPFNIINVMGLSIYKDKKHKDRPECLAVTCVGAYKYEEDLEKVIATDKSFSYFLVPLTEVELSYIYESIRPYFIYPIYYN